MSKRTAGVSLMGIAAFLISVQYITIAIFGSNTTVWTVEFFNIVKSSVGNTLKTLSILSLLGGLFYLLWAEIELVIKFIKK